MWVYCCHAKVLGAGAGVVLCMGCRQASRYSGRWRLCGLSTHNTLTGPCNSAFLNRSHLPKLVTRYARLCMPCTCSKFYCTAQIPSMYIGQPCVPWQLRLRSCDASVLLCTHRCHLRKEFALLSMQKCCCAFTLCLACTSGGLQSSC